MHNNTRLLGAVITTCLLTALRGIAQVSSTGDKQTSDVATALAEIINGLGPTSLTILYIPSSAFSSSSSSFSSSSSSFSSSSSSFSSSSSSFSSSSSSTSSSCLSQLHQNPESGIPAAESTKQSIPRKHVDDFVAQLHKRYFKSVIFYDVELYFEYIASMLRGSIESVSLIFCPPYELSERIQERRLAHRLSLFIFYWGAKQPPPPDQVRFGEPIRAVVITRPRRKAFRIYYNQAVPDGLSNLRLVNWYDADNLGLQKVPLLPNAAAVYSNFNGRVFRVPVFHSPPWFWVNHDNETNNMTSTFTNSMMDDFRVPDVGGATDVNGDDDLANDYVTVNVSGGRDHRLLQLLARHMNFQYVYIEAPGRTQGSMSIDGEANDSFTGGIGLLQLGLADLLLGDVGLSWERRKAVEFSFFTLADSGAFATHAPRRLNEALAIIRPFQLNVWPYLVLTIVLSGPIFYAIIAIPFSWSRYAEEPPVEGPEPSSFHMAYIKEITRTVGARRNHPRQVLMEQRQVPKDLLDRCIWFTVQVFLKQSFKELYHGYRAKFLMIVYCISATYVLADVYSAQLTSQFARPAREPPIDTLQRLQEVMLQDGYKLFVEKESSSLEMLENGTEIFRHLFALMKQQDPKNDGEGYLIDSVESGLLLIADGFQNKAVLGGRETLYFNIKQFGSKGFQLSHKLYTRYSAVAVQIGCPFLDSLNDVIIHLFEGGILDKMTSAEYETQSRLIAVDFNGQQQQGHASSSPSSSSLSGVTSTAAGGPDISGKNGLNGQDMSGSKGAESTELPTTAEVGVVIQPLNLRMLQGAFIVLVFGHGAAAIVFLMELLMHRWNLNFSHFCRIQFWVRCFRMAAYRVRLLMRK